MSRRKRPPKQIDVAKILNTPVGPLSEGGPPVDAFEVAMRKASIDATRGDMRAAKRFLRQLRKYCILKIPEVVDDHQYVLRIPKEWESDAWHAMYDAFGPPPWPGKHDGLIPLERWDSRYGERPKRRRPRESR